MTDEAVATMERVMSSAKDIDHVIEALDKIAFQTRVLAMNAAVEAGRAGEAGQGFAVVADLVSALAQRAEEEARHARAPLTVTREEIGNAVEVVRRTEGSFAGIIENVGGVQGMLAEIARASTEQSAALSEVNGAVTSMANVTQSTAAMVEETAAASSEMMAQIRGLEAELSRFEGHGVAPPRAGVSASAPARPVQRRPNGSAAQDGREAVVAYDRRSANRGHRVLLDEPVAQSLN